MGNSIPKPSHPGYSSIIEVPEEVLISLCSINKRCPISGTHLLMMNEPVKLNFGSILFPNLSDEIYERSAIEGAKYCHTSGRRIKGLVACRGVIKIPDYIKDLLESAIINNDLISLAKWFEHNGPSDAVLRDGTTLMYKAAEHGRNDVIYVLQQRGASVNLANKEGTHKGLYPLYVAASKGHLGAVQILLRFNARVDQLQEWSNVQGTSALFAAARFGHDDIVQALLTSGANVNLVQKHGSPFKGLTAVFIASCNGHKQTLVVLANHGALINRIITEATFEKKVTVQHNGVQRTENRILYSEYQGMSPIFVASQKGHADCVSVLLEGYDAVVDGLHGESCYGEKHTSLYIAALHQRRHTVEVLLAHGARLTKAEIAILKTKEINSADLLYEADTIHYMARDIVKSWLNKQSAASMLAQSNPGEEIRKRLFLTLYRNHRVYLSRFKLPTASYRAFVEQVAFTDLSDFAVYNTISRLADDIPLASAPPAPVEKGADAGAFMVQYMGEVGVGEQARQVVPDSPPPSYAPEGFKFN